MRQTRSTTRRASSAFRKLQSAYNLKSPEQIKLSILWHHVKAVIKNLYPDQRELLKKYDEHWQLCEEEEKRLTKTLHRSHL